MGKVGKQSFGIKTSVGTAKNLITRRALGGCAPQFELGTIRIANGEYLELADLLKSNTIPSVAICQ
eukprot:4098673-Amphidinium_carterae.1